MFGWTDRAYGVFAAPSCGYMTFYGIVRSNARSALGAIAYIVGAVAGAISKFITQIAHGRMFKRIPELVDERIGQIGAGLGELW